MGCCRFPVRFYVGALYAIAHLVRIAFETTATQALDAVFLITRDLAGERIPAIEQEMRDRHDKRPRPGIPVEGEVTQDATFIAQIMNPGDPARRGDFDAAGLPADARRQFGGCTRGERQRLL